MLKKDEKVRMCVDYRDLKKAISKDSSSLSHVDVLVDSTAGYAMFSLWTVFRSTTKLR